MGKKLPLYELKVEDTNSPMPAVTYTAMVDSPAIESRAMCFAKTPEVNLKFKIQNEERRIVTGAAMIPDLEIYRRDDTGKEFNVFFSKETIETIVKKWAMAGYHNNTNLMHDCKDKPDGVYLVESILVDAARGVSAPKILGEKFPDGTWIQSYYVKNDEVWEGFKSGKYTGFSVEGFFGTEFLEQKPEDDFLEVCQNILLSLEK